MALGGVVYIVSDHLSEFEKNDEIDNSEFNFKAKFADWINQLPLDNIKAQSLSLAQKSLHRTRILLLKTDNHLMKLIGKIAKKEKSDDFWKDVSDYKQEMPQNEINKEPLNGGEIKINLALSENLEKEFFDIKPAVNVKITKTRKSKTTPR